MTTYNDGIWQYKILNTFFQTEIEGAFSRNRTLRASGEWDEWGRWDKEILGLNDALFKAYEAKPVTLEVEEPEEVEDEPEFMDGYYFYLAYDDAYITELRGERFRDMVIESDGSWSWDEWDAVHSDPLDYLRDLDTEYLGDSLGAAEFRANHTNGVWQFTIVSTFQCWMKNGKLVQGRRRHEFLGPDWLDFDPGSPESIQRLFEKHGAERVGDNFDQADEAYEERKAQMLLSKFKVTPTTQWFFPDDRSMMVYRLSDELRPQYRGSDESDWEDSGFTLERFLKHTVKGVETVHLIHP